jgi:hypothetical protein
MAVQYCDLLAQVHDLLKPGTYLQLGVREGHSLALSSSRSIGVDPAPEIADDVRLGPDATLHRQTSDEFFAGPDPLSAFDQPVIDLAVIDGAHSYEAVLRDFQNVEKHAGPGSVVIFHGVLPRVAREATGDPGAAGWTGDVWKIVPTLREIRPDLILLLIRTTPGGSLLVLGADPTNTDLAVAQENLLARYASSDQVPPVEIITRATAVYPTWVVGAPFWEMLRSQREWAVTAAEGRQELLDSLQEWASTTLNDRPSL